MKIFAWVVAVITQSNNIIPLTVHTSVSDAMRESKIQSEKRVEIMTIIPVYRGEKDIAMSDKEFLQWIFERLHHVYQESPNFDYMRRLQQIIDAYDPEKKTWQR